MTERNLKQEAQEKRQDEQAPTFIVRASKLSQALSEGYITEYMPKDAPEARIAKARKFAIVNNIVATGVYQGLQANKFNPTKKDIILRLEDGTRFVLNSTASLEEQIAGVEGLEGEVTLTVEYGGKLAIGDGRSKHDFTVLVK